MNGKGTLTLENGERVIGEFKEGFPADGPMIVEKRNGDKEWRLYKEKIKILKRVDGTSLEEENHPEDRYYRVMTKN